MEPGKHEFWDDDQQLPRRTRRKTRISIKKIMVITATVAAAAVCMGHLVRAALSDGNGMEVGQFVVITAMMPTAFLAVVSLLYSVFGRIID